ncbi:MAG: hypothetical protein ACW9W9_00875 [Candidatus Nitrosopumilus sp. Bin_571-38]|jgi:hypothetical protein
MNCKHCGKKFLGKNAIFCSMICCNEYAEELEKRIKGAVEKDPSHTKKMSDM